MEASDPHHSEAGYRFGAGLMPGIAYAARVGGIARLIGTRPNAILAGQVRQRFPKLGKIRFLGWMLVGVLLAGSDLLVTWLYLAFVSTRFSSGPRPGAGQIGTRSRRDISGDVGC